MAANYQSGVCNNTDDLLAIIDTFLTGTLSWTKVYHNVLEKVDNNVSNESYHRNTYYYQHAGQYFFLAGGVEGLSVDYRTYIRGGCLNGVVNTATGLSPYAYDDQDGYQYSFVANDLAGPFTKYHLFGGQEGLNGEYFYCCVETAAGVFTHFGLGRLDKIGSIDASFAVGLFWSQSGYYWQNPSSGYHQRMFDGWSSFDSGSHGHISFYQLGTVPPAPEQYIFGYNSANVYGSMGGSMGQYLYEDSPNAYNGRTTLIPQYIHCDDRGSPSWQRIVGLAPAIRFLNITNLQPEDLVDTDWIVFPMKAKNATTGASSAAYGIAYRWQET